MVLYNLWPNLRPLPGVHDAQVELDQYECNVESMGGVGSAPGTETTRLRKPYKMALKTERSGSRFVAQTDEGKPVIRLDLFHDTISGLQDRSQLDSSCLVEQR